MRKDFIRNALFVGTSTFVTTMGGEYLNYVFQGDESSLLILIGSYACSLSVVLFVGAILAVLSSRNRKP